MDKTSQIIDQIYGAALDASVWPSALRTIQNLFNCSAAGIYTADLQNGRISHAHVRSDGSGSLRRHIDEMLHDNLWGEISESPAPARGRADLAHDADQFAPDFARGTAWRYARLKPQDFIHALDSDLHVDGHIQTKFFICRPRLSGPFSAREIARFEWLCVHLTNAVRIARRLAQQEARAGATFDTVDCMEFGVVLLDETGHVTQANRFAEELFTRRDGLLVSSGRLVATHREDGKRLAAAMHAASAPQQGQSSAAQQYISLRRPGRKRPLCVIVVPLPQRCSNPFLPDRASMALIVTDPELDPVIPVEWLRQHYALTATEARLAQSLTQGSPLRQAAEQHGLTYETARWYLKSIFQKTGTTRQPELVRLVLSEKIVVGHG